MCGRCFTASAILFFRVCRLCGQHRTRRYFLGNKTYSQRRKIIMKRLIAIILVVTAVLLSACNSSSSVNVAEAKSIADLKGAKIAAQTGTFHAEAMKQIEGNTADTYPEFSDMLTALKSGAIDGYIAEEPTALPYAPPTTLLIISVSSTTRPDLPQPKSRPALPSQSKRVPISSPA